MPDIIIPVTFDYLRVPITTQNLKIFTQKYETVYNYILDIINKIHNENMQKFLTREHFNEYTAQSRLAKFNEFVYALALDHDLLTQKLRELEKIFQNIDELQLNPNAMQQLTNKKLTQLYKLLSTSSAYSSQIHTINQIIQKFNNMLAIYRTQGTFFYISIVDKRQHKIDYTIPPTIITIKKPKKTIIDDTLETLTKYKESLEFQ